jgi:hypothetical protein
MMHLLLLCDMVRLVLFFNVSKYLEGGLLHGMAFDLVHLLVHGLAALGVLVCSLHLSFLCSLDAGGRAEGLHFNNKFYIFNFLTVKSLNIFIFNIIDQL